MSSHTEAESFVRLLRDRRSMSRMKPDAVPRELVQQVLDAAGWAPNHFKTEPWRFTVLAGEARVELGEVMANALRARLGGVTDDHADTVLAKERAKPLRAPVVIVVSVVPNRANPRVVEIEELAATAAAVQNMLLAAHAMGLGAMWRTGDAAYDPAVKRFLGIDGNDHLLAFVYLGYPDLPALPERRRSVDQHVRWLGWDRQSPSPEPSPET